MPKTTAITRSRAPRGATTNQEQSLEAANKSNSISSKRNNNIDDPHNKRRSWKSSLSRYGWIVVVFVGAITLSRQQRTSLQKALAEKGSQAPPNNNHDTSNQNTPHSKSTATADKQFYPYGGFSCPLEMAPYAQPYQAYNRQRLLALNSSIFDGYQLNEASYDEERGKAAQQVSIQHRTLETVQQALRSGSFTNRTIRLVGDSHTRQLFMSLGCLLHASNPHAWVGHDVEWEHKAAIRGPGSGTALDLLQMTPNATHSKLTQGTLQLRNDDGVVTNTSTILYEWYMWPAKLKRAWMRACNQRRPTLITGMTEHDVIVISAGTHGNARKFLLSVLKDIFTCIRNQRQEKPGALAHWPQFVYMLNPVTHFWTEDGDYEGPKLKDADSSNESIRASTCNPHAAYHGFQTDEWDAIGDLVVPHTEYPINTSSINDTTTAPVRAVLGAQMNQSSFVNLHPAYGDCAHYYQPGPPDILAADLAKYIMTLPPVE